MKCDLKPPSLVVQTVKRLPTMWETWVGSLGREDPLEKETATHSGTLAWKIPWTEKPIGYSLWGCKESDGTSLSLSFLDFPGGSEGKSVCLQCGRPGFGPCVGKIPWRRKWQPTPVLLPGKSHGQRSLVGYSLWGRKESNTTE